MKLFHTLPALAAAVALSGCGGGGGGGGGIPSGTFTAGSTRTGLSTFRPNAISATASGDNVRITAEERVGDLLNYTTSRRLTLTLFGPVTVRSYPVGGTRQPGTCLAVYTVTQKNSSGAYVTESEWRGTAGSVNVLASNSTHIEATFDATMRNVAGSATFQFTNGKLNLTYESPPPPPG